MAVDKMGEYAAQAAAAAKVQQSRPALNQSVMQMQQVDRNKGECPASRAGWGCQL